MSPIVSTLAGASARGYGGLGASVASAAVGAYESIATVTVGASTAASIAFTSIPSTYQHLQIRGILRGTPTYPDGEYGFVRINGDASSIYSATYQGGNGTVAFSGSFGGTTSSWVISQIGTTNGDLANTFGGNIWDFLDYKDTNKNRTMRGWLANGRQTTGTAGLAAGSYRSTSAITSIEVLPGGGSGWLQYSTLALYGIKG